MKTHIGRMLNAMAWADAELLCAIRDSIWHANRLAALSVMCSLPKKRGLRLESREQRCVVWPTLSLAECQELAAENTRGYQHYFEKLTDSDLTSEVRYRNTKGDGYANSVLDILTHVVIHGAYHRGQIARIIGRGGGVTPNTDYIAYVRSLE